MPRRRTRRGVRVRVLCATRGEDVVPDMDPKETGRMREAELQCACRALGIEPSRFLIVVPRSLAKVVGFPPHSVADEEVSLTVAVGFVTSGKVQMTQGRRQARSK